MSNLRGLKRGPAVGIAVATVIFVALIGVGLVNRANTNDSPPTATVAQSASPSTTPSVTPHDICTLQVYAMAAHINDQRDGISQEILVNGENDPFIYPARYVYNRLAFDVYSVGKSMAKQKAIATAATICGEKLNDQIRANYPTDGTYPDGGSSDSSGGSGMPDKLPCPVGTQIRGSDGVCRD